MKKKKQEENVLKK